MKRSLIAVVAALLLAVIGCGAVLLYVRSADARALRGKQAVTVLLATKRIPAGTTGEQIRAGQFVEAAAMPAISVPSDALSEIDASLDDLVLTADLQPRQLLLRGAFGADAKLAGGLAIPEGKLAVTVAAQSTYGVPFIRPGSKVAVFDTYTVRTEAPGRVPSGDKGPYFEYPRNHATRLLLPRVEVLAVGLPGELGAQTSSGQQQTQPSDAEAKAKDSDPQTLMAVTFAVNQDEAERLIHAMQTGVIYIALLDESSQVRPGQGVDNSTLFR